MFKFTYSIYTPVALTQNLFRHPQPTMLRKFYEKKMIEETLAVASGGGGNAGTLPPPETGKIVVEIWCYLPEVYTFGAESEIQEIFSKKL